MKLDKFFTDKETKGLQPHFVTRLVKARTISGTPYVVTSGYRASDTNKAVGGVSGSAHCKGLAVDLRAGNSRERYLILKGLFAAGFTRIIPYDKHIHVDMDDTKPQEVYPVEAKSK